MNTGTTVLRISIGTFAAQLLGQLGIVLLATIGHRTPPDQPPDERANAEGSQQRAVPEGGDLAALAGHAVGQEAALDRLTTTAECQRAAQRESRAQQDTPRQAGRGAVGTRQGAHPPIVSDQPTALGNHADLGRAAGTTEVVEELDVGLVVVLPLLGGVVRVEDGLDRTHRLGGATVDALGRMDVEQALTLVDAVDWALLDAGLVLDVSPRLGDHVSHLRLLSGSFESRSLGAQCWADLADNCGELVSHVGSRPRRQGRRVTAGHGSRPSGRDTDGVYL